MAKMSNKNYFGRAKRDELEVIQEPVVDVKNVADRSEVLTLVDAPEIKDEITVVKNSPAPTASSPDETEQLVKRVGELETRVLLLENKLKTLINVITKEMSAGLKQGPEGLARAIKNSGVLDNI